MAVAETAGGGEVAVGAAADELPTPAHTGARAFVGVRLQRAGAVHSLTLRVDNLPNSAHREATSRTKEFAPGPGRSVALLYRVYV